MNRSSSSQETVFTMSVAACPLSATASTARVLMVLGTASTARVLMVLGTASTARVLMVLGTASTARVLMVLGMKVLVFI